MGRLFTAEQLERNEVPGPIDFEVATSAFLDASQLAIDHGKLAGTLIYGSVASGRAGQRSDFDCAYVLHDSKQLTTARSINRQTYLGGNKIIPVNAMAYTIRQLQSGQVELQFDRFYARHLADGNRLVTGMDMTALLALPDVPVDQVFTNYIRNKKRSLAEPYVNSMSQPGPDIMLDRLQRLLELPVAVGRKLLAALDEIDGTDRTPSDTSDKRSVAEQSLDVYAELGISAIAKRLLAADRKYSQKVETMAGHRVRQPYYQKYLEHLVDLIPAAHNWLNKLDDAFCKRIGKTTLA